jgi:hypothetical protein
VQRAGLRQDPVVVGELELDLGADRSRRAGVERVPLAGRAAVLDRVVRRAVRGGADGRARGDDERRQEAEPEHADQLLGVAALAQVTRVADADRGQEPLHLFARHPGAVVADHHDAARRVGVQLDPAVARAERRVLDAAARDRVVRVLHQLPDRHRRRGVRVRPEHRHQAAEIDLRGVDAGGHPTTVPRQADGLTRQSWPRMGLRSPVPSSDARVATRRTSRAPSSSSV